MLQLHDKLSKRLNSIAMQLRTIKIDLQTFLYRKKTIENFMCSCMRSKQTIKHVFFRMHEIERTSQKFMNRKDSKDEVKKDEIDRRVNEFEQFEEDDEFYREI